MVPYDNVSLFFEASINDTNREFLRKIGPEMDSDSDKLYFNIEHDGNIGWDYYLYPGSGFKMYGQFIKFSTNKNHNYL